MLQNLLIRIKKENYIVKDTEKIILLRYNDYKEKVNNIVVLEEKPIKLVNVYDD